MGKNIQRQMKQLKNKTNDKLGQKIQLTEEEIDDLPLSSREKNQLISNDGIIEVDDDEDYEDAEVAPSLRSVDKNEKVKQYNREISIVEFAVFNKYLYQCLNNNIGGFKTTTYGEVSNTGTLTFGGEFKPVLSWWFNLESTNILPDVNIIIQTSIDKNNYGEIYCRVNISFEEGQTNSDLSDYFDEFKKTAFNNSVYKGKCLKVSVRDGNFQGIDIINMESFEKELILTKTQNQYIKHFVKRVGRGGNARYMLNGTPGTGKTDSIRRIIFELTPEITFVIPDFYNSRDLTMIMEACEIFNPGVIVIDDIDLYLGNREKGGYTSLLGEFLSFFDGVKKRKISLLASTNDKSLVDKAAERPGRFNVIIDFGYLDDEQTKAVANIHLDKKWQVEAVYDLLTGSIDGKKVKVTGAFIANLAENIDEMSEDMVDEGEWTLDDTLRLIKDSYIGFYYSQVEKNKGGIGFKS
jgi:hypothetical protein|tara:strand:- start:10958 stop:12352 length:1395 start_codon:yes stop_codon:yes gene_type:complete